MTETLFSKIIDREIPADIVYEDDQCLCFKDVNPQAPVHYLLIPKKPIDRLTTAESDDQELLGYLMLKAAEIAGQAGIGDACRVIVNKGPGAGQTVYHLHIHILGGRAMGWPPG